MHSSHLICWVKASKTLLIVSGDVSDTDCEQGQTERQQKYLPMSALQDRYTVATLHAVARALCESRVQAFVASCEEGGDSSRGARSGIELRGVQKIPDLVLITPLQERESENVRAKAS